MKSVVRTFMQPAILRVYGSMIAYVALVIYGLQTLGLWEFRQLKDTIIWFVFVAAMSIFGLPQSADDHAYLKDAIKDNLKLIMFIEFVVALYPFNLWAELLIVPFGAFLGIMIVMAEREEKLKSVATILNGVATVAGVIILSAAVLDLVKDFREFATLGKLADFILPSCSLYCSCLSYSRSR